MINSYALQISIMKTLVIDAPYVHILGKKYANGDYRSWASLTPTQYLSKMLEHTGQVVALTSGLSIGETITMGSVCRQVPSTFNLSRPSYYAVSLVLLVPLIWWVSVWILSLYRTNGVSRGQSLVALLVAGLTPAVQREFQGMSQANQYTLIKHARGVRVRLGEVGVEEAHATLGLSHEVEPLRVRRNSFWASYPSFKQIPSLYIGVSKLESFRKLSSPLLILLTLYIHPSSLIVPFSVLLSTQNS